MAQLELPIRVSFSGMTAYYDCQEKYRREFLKRDEVREDEEVIDHYYAMMGTLLQSIFENVTKMWYNGDLKRRYYSESKLFRWIDEDIKVISEKCLKSIDEYKEAIKDGNTIVFELNNIIDEFRIFPVEIRRYGSVKTIVERTLAKATREIYKEPLLSYIHNVLLHDEIEVEVEKVIKQRLNDDCLITGFADFVIYNKNTNEKWIWDGKRKYDDRYHSPEQLLLYAFALGANKIGFWCYKTNTLFDKSDYISKLNNDGLEYKINKMVEDLKTWDIDTEKPRTKNKNCKYCALYNSCSVSKEKENTNVLKNIEL